MITAPKTELDLPQATLGSVHTRPVTRAVDVMRIGLGFVFLWAFLDKLFGLGYSTSAAGAWVKGGSPTNGFLAHVEAGPFQSLLRGIAGSGVADWLFMLGLLGIGVALMSGVAIRVAAIAGAVLVVLMWVAEWPLAAHTPLGAASGSTNPLVDYHLIFAVGLWIVAVLGTGSSWGLGVGRQLGQSPVRQGASVPALITQTVCSRRCRPSRSAPAD